MSDWQPGQSILDRFELIRRLGRGGMSTVWLALDTERGEQIALKVLVEEIARHPAAVELLRNECRNLRRLSHPNIVRVYDFHQAESIACFSMEFVEGRCIDTLRGGEHAAIALHGAGVADGLAHAHEQGIVHRDIKTANVLLDVDDRVRITDFGIASAIHAGSTSFDIRTGGSLSGMSPQQFQKMPPTPADDIYALGALLYELLSGTPPLGRTPGADEIAASVPTSLRDIASRDQSLPAELADLIDSMLAKSPGDRPADMTAVHAALSRHAPAEPAGDSDIITPITRRSPAEQLVVDLPGPGRSLPAKPVLAVLGALVVVAVGVVAVLPRLVNGPDDEIPAPVATTESTRSPAPDVPVVTIDPELLAAQKAEAERLLGLLLSAQGRLESQGVELWGSEAYAQASDVVREGDDAFLTQQFEASATAYERALELLDALSGRTDQELVRALQAGLAAIDAGDAQAAKAAFELALMLDPTNRAADDGLIRAGNLDAVLALMKSGREQELSGALAAAANDYRQARELDPEWQDAATGLARVQRAIANNAYQRSLNAGFAALAGEDFDAARQAFEAAQRLRPNAQEPRDGLLQTDQARRLAAIGGHRARGKAFEALEKWPEAIAEYRSALELDENLSFAQEGLERSQARGFMDERLRFLIANPSRLFKHTGLNEARGLLEQAGGIDPQGRVLIDQGKRLSELVQIATTPIKVSLQSDNLTEVVVYRVGSLGSFEQHELTLTPGAYTAVGTRTGFRDVRIEFSIVPGRTPPLVVVRCEEAI